MSLILTGSGYWAFEDGVDTHSWDRMFQGGNIRAPMDGFTASPGSEYPPQRPPTGLSGTAVDLIIL